MKMFFIELAQAAVAAGLLALPFVIYFWGWST